jgi:hypothetical protein
MRPMTAMGHQRPRRSKPPGHPRLLRSESGHAQTQCDMSALCRLCCKSPKLPGDNFPAIRRSDLRLPICVPSITLRRSSASLSSGDEAPHIFTRRSRLKPGEFSITSAKRLLQHNLPLADICSAANCATIRSARRRGREFPRKGLASNRFSDERFTWWSSVTAPSSTFPSRTVEWLIYHSTVHRLESESSVDITADAVPEPNRFSPVA